MGVPRCICKDGFFGETCHLHNEGGNSSLGLVGMIRKRLVYVQFTYQFIYVFKKLSDTRMFYPIFRFRCRLLFEQPIQLFEQKMHTICPNL